MCAISRRPTHAVCLQVAEVSMPDGASWLGTEDHSKWVIFLYITESFKIALFICLCDRSALSAILAQLMFAWATSTGCALKKSAEEAQCVSIMLA